MRKVIPLLILLAGLALVFGFGLDRYFSIEVLRENHADLQAFVDRHPVYAPILFCLVYATSTALSVPGGALLTVVGGFLFGTVFGTIFSVTGATIGATLLFFAARTAFADLLRARAGSGIERMRARFRENALSYMLFLRLIPAFPFFVVNLAPAFLGVPLSVYVLGTFVGIIPGSLVYTLVGSGLGEFFERDEALSLSSVLTPEILLGLTGLAVLALVPVVYKRLRKHGGSV